MTNPAELHALQNPGHKATVIAIKTGTFVSLRIRCESCKFSHLETFKA